MLFLQAKCGPPSRSSPSQSSESLHDKKVPLVQRAKLEHGPPETLPRVDRCLTDLSQPERAGALSSVYNARCSLAGTDSPLKTTLQCGTETAESPNGPHNGVEASHSPFSQHGPYSGVSGISHSFQSHKAPQLMLSPVSSTKELSVGPAEVALVKAPPVGNVCRMRRADPACLRDQSAASCGQEMSSAYTDSEQLINTLRERQHQVELQKQKLFAEELSLRQSIEFHTRRCLRRTDVEKSDMPVPAAVLPHVLSGSSSSGILQEQSKIQEVEQSESINKGSSSVLDCMPPSTRASHYAHSGSCAPKIMRSTCVTQSSLPQTLQNVLLPGDLSRFEIPSAMVEAAWRVNAQACVAKRSEEAVTQPCAPSQAFSTVPGSFIHSQPRAPDLSDSQLHSQRSVVNSESSLSTRFGAQWKLEASPLSSVSCTIPEDTVSKTAHAPMDYEPSVSRDCNRGFLPVVKRCSSPRTRERARASHRRRLSPVNGRRSAFLPLKARSRKIDLKSATKSGSRSNSDRERHRENRKQVSLYNGLFAKQICTATDCNCISILIP